MAESKRAVKKKVVINGKQTDVSQSGQTEELEVYNGGLAPVSATREQGIDTNTQH